MLLKANNNSTDRNRQFSYYLSILSIGIPNIKPFVPFQIYLKLELPFQVWIKKEVDKWYGIFRYYPLLPAVTYYFFLISPYLTYIIDYTN